MTESQIQFAFRKMEAAVDRDEKKERQRTYIVIGEFVVNYWPVNIGSMRLAERVRIGRSCLPECDRD